MIQHGIWQIEFAQLWDKNIQHLLPGIVEFDDSFVGDPVIMASEIGVPIKPKSQVVLFKKENQQATVIRTHIVKNVQEKALQKIIRPTKTVAASRALLY